MSDIPRDVRDAVGERDNYRCCNCGEMDTSKLHLHHVQYRSLMGTDEADNLVTLCALCHNLVHDKKLLVKRVGNKWFFSRPWRHK